MKEQTLELNIDINVIYNLRALSHFATLFYNTALGQREEHPDAHLNRTKQMRGVAHIYTSAGIDPLPNSTAYQLLLELDVVTYTPARSRKRSLDRFYALTWTGDDIEVDKDGILLQPNIRLPLPEFEDAPGIISRIRVKTILNGVAIVHFTWKHIPLTGPGRDRKRAFGYTPPRGALEKYIRVITEASGIARILHR